MNGPGAALPSAGSALPAAGVASAPAAPVTAEPSRWLPSLRTRLVLFAVLCAVPVFTLIAVQRSSDAARIQAEARKDVAAAANQLQLSVGELLASAEALGRTVAVLDLDAPGAVERCNQALALARQATENHVLNYSVLAPSGRVVCSGKAVPPDASFADRPYFIQALAQRSPVLSGYVMGRVTGVDSLQLAIPQSNAAGAVVSVTVVAIDARSLTHTLVTAVEPGMVLALYDQHGVLVSRLPDSDRARAGARYPATGIGALLAAGASGGEGTGPDGVPRLYELRPIRFAGFVPLTAVAGQDTGPLEQSAAAVRRKLALISMGALLLVMGVASVAARPLVLARARPLLDATARVGAGEWVRVRRSVRDELTPVETGFNAMLDQLEAKRLELERSERRYRLLFDRGADGVLHLGRDGEILAANGAACRLLGRTEAQLCATSWQLLVDPSDERAVNFPLRAEAPRVVNGELRLLHPDGSAVECELSASLFGSGHEDGLASVVIRDLTLRLREQRQLAEMNRRLEARVHQRTAELKAAVEDMTAFSYSVSHDLRAPMGAINGFACVLEERNHLTDPKDRHYLSRIVACSTHANSLIDGLQLLSRVTRDDLALRDVDLGELARTALEYCRDAEPDRDVAFAVEGDLRVRGDRNLLQILMDNLVGNAWKFTSGVARPTILIERRPDGEAGEWVFHVRDNGAGFDPAHAGRLFEPFQRLHSTREFPGTGIGLATVRRVVRRHGGRVWAESSPGQGTSIFFTLPQAGSAASAGEQVHG